MDVHREIGATRRAVGAREGDLAVVTLARTYPTDVDDLWAACTDPERIARWFLPVHGDLRLGGRYRIEGNASGEITACDPPRGFDATWEIGDQATWIEVRFAPDGDGARLELAHIAPAGGEHWLRYGPGATGIGWDLGLLGLAAHLETGAGVDPAEGAAWVASPEGAEFMAASARAWERADAAGGTDADVAGARARRTVAAYTGVEEPAADAEETPTTPEAR